MTINVTEFDILHGEAGKCFSCPISLAIERVFPECKGASVTAGNALIFMKDFHDKRFVLPAEATQFIRAFDHGHPVAPFSFILTPAEHP